MQLAGEDATSAELDTENAHFRMSEALIVAMEQARHADLVPSLDLRLPRLREQGVCGDDQAHPIHVPAPTIQL